jgi:hypothetical protein
MKLHARCNRVSDAHRVQSLFCLRMGYRVITITGNLRYELIYPRRRGEPFPAELDGPQTDPANASKAPSAERVDVRPAGNAVGCFRQRQIGQRAFVLHVRSQLEASRPRVRLPATLPGSITNPANRAESGIQGAPHTTVCQETL